MIKRPYFFILFFTFLIGCKTEESKEDKKSVSHSDKVEWVAHKTKAYLLFNVINFFDDTLKKVDEIDLVEDSPQSIKIIAISKRAYPNNGIQSHFVKVMFKGEEKVITSDIVLVLAEEHTAGKIKFHVTNGLNSHNTLRYVIVIDENQKAYFITDLEGEYDPPRFFIYQDKKTEGWYETLESVESIEDGYIFHIREKDKTSLKKIFVKNNKGEWLATEKEISRIQGFIPHGYEITKSKKELNKVHIDVNNDGIKDYVLLLAQGKNDGEYSKTKDIRLSVFEGQKNGTYVLKAQTGNLTTSFLHYNQNRVIKVSNKKVISLFHYSMRHDYELKFRYEPKYNNYMLIGSELNNYGKGTVSVNYLSKKKKVYLDKTITLEEDLKPISTINDNTIYKLISE